MQLEGKAVAAATALVLTIGLMGIAPTAAGAAAPLAAAAPPAATAPAAAAATPQASASPAAAPAFGSTNLGKYAFNGIVRAATTDPATGVVYVGGDFTQVGVRTGSVAMVNPPGSGSDQLMAASPEVIGQQFSVFADDSSHYFLAGRVASINGDGVQRTPLVRMTSSGQVDTSWQLHGLCNKWQTIGWDIGKWLVSDLAVSTDTSGLSTVGLQLIDKATGNAYVLGAGSSSGCPAASRMWSSTGVFPPLSDCAGWYVCDGYVEGVVFDPASNVLLVETSVLAYKTVADASASAGRDELVAYDMSTGNRLWWTGLTANPPSDWPTSAGYGSQVYAMAAFNGVILAEGLFELGPTDPDPSATASTMILIDEHTGTILQRWNDSGEQDMADPTQTTTPPTDCTPGYNTGYNPLADLLIRRSATSVIGYAAPVAIDGGNRLNVCSYGITGSGTSARLTSSKLGTLDSPGVVGSGVTMNVPSVIYGDRYLTGGDGAFDLSAGQQVADWDPKPSNGAAAIVVGSSIVLGGDFTFIHGTAANHVDALDANLAPLPGFVAGIPDPPSGVSSIRDIAVAGSDVVVTGRIYGTFGTVAAVALNVTTGSLDWTTTPSAYPNGYSLAADPQTGGFYLGQGGAGVPVLSRYKPAAGGFALDTSFSHTFGAEGSVSPWISNMALIGGRLYIGGVFSSVDGVARQGLARLTAQRTLDSWAPPVFDEMQLPANATVTMQTHGFAELNGDVVVSGEFTYETPVTGGSTQGGIAPVEVYSASTGAQVHPPGPSWPWINGDVLWGYGLAVSDDTIYVAMGFTGLAAFDARTFAYLPDKSDRSPGDYGDNEVYAITSRTSQTTTSAKSAGASPSAAAVPAKPKPTVVIGGSLSRWSNRSAGNVVELAPYVPPTPATYHAITPVRLLDTRNGTGLSGKLTAGKPRTFKIAGVKGIPSGALAITGNATVVNSTAASSIYLGPIAIAKPSTYAMSFNKGQIANRGITVALSPTGTLSLTYRASSGTADLVLDVSGYFSTASGGDTYHPMTPARLLDTRVNNGLSGKLKANTPRTFKIWGRGGVPKTARAVTGNVTVVNSTNAWAIYLGPAPISKPKASTINFLKGQIAGNSLTVALSSSGTLSATFMSGAGATTDLVFDVTGYYTADATGLRYVPLTPASLLDTRSGIGMTGKFSANTPRTFAVRGHAGVPANAAGITGVVSVVNQTASWALGVGPVPATKPTTSALNFLKGDVCSNGVTVALSSTGTLSLTYMSGKGNTTNVVLFVTGYFVK